VVEKERLNKNGSTEGGRERVRRQKPDHGQKSKKFRLYGIATERGSRLVGEKRKLGRN